MPSLPAMTVVEALGSIPIVIQDSLGERALERCLSSAGLPLNISEQPGSFVTEESMSCLLDQAAIQTGDDLFGLAFVPRLSVEEYGVWGQYVLEAPTLAAALSRASKLMHLHADNDTLILRRGRSSAKLEYNFGDRRGRGYRQVALASLGPMFSIARHYLGRTWRPLSIGLDLDEKQVEYRLEMAFETKVRTDQTCVSMEIPNLDLDAKLPAHETSRLTAQDVVRFCRGGPPNGLVPIVQNLVVQRLGVEAVSLNDIAQAMSISRRTLQRRLNQEGVEFRDLLGSVIMQRAGELLSGTLLTVSEIGFQLGYSTVGHFARAFRGTYGMAPLEYRLLSGPSRSQGFHSSHSRH